MKIEDEPTLSSIDDYENHESPEKRKTIYFIIGALVVLAIVFGIIKQTNNKVSDYIGTPENPGIDLNRR